MTTLSELDLDVTDVDAVTDRREELLAALKNHAGQVAYNVARIQGGDYGRHSFSTVRGEWTVKHEAGELDFLLYDPRGASEIYVVSTQSTIDPESLTQALDDYEEFVAAYNEWVTSLDGYLDDIDGDYPAIDSAEQVAAERDRLVETIESACEQMAGELYRYEGTDFGTFTERIDGTRWELKREKDSPSYLRVGGTGGVYLLSQYGQPAATDVREYAPRFSGFLEAYNSHVATLELDLTEIDL